MPRTLQNGTLYKWNEEAAQSEDLNAFMRCKNVILKLFCRDPVPPVQYLLICFIGLLLCPMSNTYSANEGIATSIFVVASQQGAIKNKIHLPANKEKATIQAPLNVSEGAKDAQLLPASLDAGEATLLQSADISSDLPDNLGEKSFSEDSMDNNAATQELESTIPSITYYSSKKSVVFNAKNKTIYMSGDGFVEYDNLRLEAEEVILDWVNHTFEARSKKNEAGEVEKKAILTQDEVVYIVESVRYNFASQRGIASKLFTKQDDVIFRANKIKKDGEDTFYADKGTYTTCNLVRPHFHAEAQKFKLKQGDKVVSGPCTLHFDSVPTFAWPFGIFYFQQSSGIILPKYGGESNKGFCIRDGGYYINFNDYADLALQGEIYSKGSTGFTAQSRYKKRYRYGGDLRYKRSIHVSPSEEQLTEKEKSWHFQWNHRTENNRISSLNAEVDLQSESFRKQNTPPGDASLQASMSSSIRYTNRLIGFPYSLSTSLSYAKNFRTETAIATIPSISLRTGQIYPFRKKGSTVSSWYQDVYFQHVVDLENKLSNKIDGEQFDFSPPNWALIFRKGKYGVRHTIPLTTHIKALSYLSLSPIIQYQERWYWERINYNTNTGEIEERVPGFVRVYDYSFGTELKTTLYGTHLFSSNSAVKAIRHQLEPIIRVTYTPDFSSPEYGYWQTINSGKKCNRFEGAIYGSPKDRATAVMKIDLNNRLDIKVKNNAKEKEETQKLPILESFDWSTSYDFLAKSHPLDDVHLKAYTRLFDKLIDVNFKSTFDPYIYRKSVQNNEKEWEKIDELAWNHGQGIGRVKESSFSIGTQLSPGGEDKTLDQYNEPEKKQDGQEEEMKHIQENPEQYVDFKIPWKLLLNYEWHYKSPLPEEHSTTSVLSFGGEINLTKKWRTALGSAYDIKRKELIGTKTNISIYRDLHCWEMNFSWQPLGTIQRYEFSIGLKSPLLQYLKYNRSRTYKNF